MSRRILAGLALILVSSGCLGSDTNATDTATMGEAGIITDPADYSDLASNGSHVHDYWGGKKSIAIFDGGFTLTGNTQCPALAGPQPCKEVQITEGAVVNPGTGWVNITLKFSSNAPSQYASLRLDYRSADTSPSNPNRTGSRVFRGPDTWSISTTDNMTDLAHSRATGWYFFAYALVPPGFSMDVQLKIEIFRGPNPIPVAPPHPDFWGTNRTLVVLDRKGTMNDPLGLDLILKQNASPPTSVAPAAPMIVPPETVTLVVRLDYNSSTPSQVHYQPLLTGRGADRKYSNEWQEIPPTTKSVQSQNGYYEWRLTVEPRMWDSFYATSTAWQLFAVWNGKAIVVSPTHMQGNYHLVTMAERGTSR